MIKDYRQLIIIYCSINFIIRCLKMYVIFHSSSVLRYFNNLLVKPILHICFFETEIFLPLLTISSIDLKGITRCKLAVIFEPANHRKFLACFRPPQTFYRFIFFVFLTSIYTNLWHGRGGRTVMEQFEKMPSLGSSRLHLVIPFKSMLYLSNLWSVPSRVHWKIWNEKRTLLTKFSLFQTLIKCAVQLI